jgi:hypothetical protein
MADTIEIELIENSDIQKEYRYWQNFEFLRRFLLTPPNEVNIYKVKLEIDTSTDGTLTESTKPTNEVHNFTTPQQVYARSSNAGDTSKTFYVIGQKSDGSFGIFDYDTDDTDGTTAVDLGTWNFIAFVYDCDTLTGNLIVDDDGSSTTVFWTLTNGGDASDGILVIPEGYHGVIIAGQFSAIAEPSTPATDGMIFDLEDSWSGHINIYNSIDKLTHLRSDIIEEKTRIDIKHAYINAATDSEWNFLLMVYKE